MTLQTDQKPIARSISVAGHVQGVFFREWTVTTAKALGIAGWVRNRRGREVEICAVGEPAQLEHFIAELHNGSPASRVDQVDVQPAELANVPGHAPQHGLDTFRFT
jgi:acylphosphatase